MRRYLNTTAALAALLIACGKDEPAPQPAAATPEVQATPAEAPKAEEKPRELGGSASPTPSSAAPPAPVVLAPLVATPFPGERAQLTPTTIANFPTDIVAVGGTPSLQALVASVAAWSKKIPNSQVPDDPLAAALNAMQGVTGIDMAWLDADKPLRFAVPDPKKYPEGFYVLVQAKPGTTQNLLKATGATPGNGHFVTLDVGGKKVFIDEAPGDLVIVTSHDDLAKSLGGFTTELAAWVPKDALVLESSGENLLRVYAEDLAKAKEFVGMMTSAGGDDPQVMRMANLATGGFALVEGAARLSMALDFAGDFPRVGFGFVGQPGSPLEGIAKSLADHKIAYAGMVPADAWLALGFDVEGASLMQDAQAVVDAMTKSGAGPLAQIAWTDDERAQMVGLLQKAQSLSGSQNMMWLRQDGERPFVFESVSSSKDGAELQKTLFAFADLFYSKIWGQLRPMAIAQGMSEAEVPAQMAFEDFLKLASSKASPLGISMAVGKGSTKAGSQLSSFELGVDWSRLPPRAELAAVAKVVGNSYGFSLSGEGQAFTTVIGPNAIERATRLLDAAATPPEATDPWLAMAKDHALFAMLRPARLMRALMGLVPDLASKGAEIGQIPDDPIVVRGKSDGKQLYLELTVPLQALVAIDKIR